MNLPVVEGGSVCVYDDKWTTIDYSGTEFLKFADEYKETLTAAGWRVGDLQNYLYYTALKGDIAFTITFEECSKSFTSPGTWGNCTSVKYQKTEIKNRPN